MLLRRRWTVTISTDHEATLDLTRGINPNALNASYDWLVSFSMLDCRHSGDVCFQLCLSFSNTPTSLLILWVSPRSLGGASYYEPKAMQLQQQGGVFTRETTAHSPLAGDLIRGQVRC